jgi:hypothetical protein
MDVNNKDVWWCRGDNKTGGGKEAKISVKLTAPAKQQQMSYTNQSNQPN